MNYFEGVFGNKKQKTNEKSGCVEKFLVLSPIFALLANFGQNLTNDCWETRQVAASGLSSLLSIISPSESLKFMIVEKTPQNYKLS